MIFKFDFLKTKIEDIEEHFQVLHNDKTLTANKLKDNIYTFKIIHKILRIGSARSIIFCSLILPINELVLG